MEEYPSAVKEFYGGDLQAFLRGKFKKACEEDPDLVLQYLPIQLYADGKVAITRGAIEDFCQQMGIEIEDFMEAEKYPQGEIRRFGTRKWGVGSEDFFRLGTAFLVLGELED